ncbi:hypothetical protein JOM56_005557 [Amanita muscaria]
MAEGANAATECIPEPEYTWHPPEYKFSTESPPLRYNLSLPDGQNAPANFMRSAKWSPDGLSVLGNREDGSFQLYEMYCIIQSYVYCNSDVQDTSVDLTDTVIQPRASFRQPSPILDFLWYPSASLHNPASYCFVASVRECPVRLFEAFTGRLRASYKIIDHCERQVAPHSMSFNPTASRLYCGFENAIEVFDVQNPGEGTRLHTTPSRKSNDGLKGIISALAFSSDGSFSDAYFAAGSLSSYSHNIALYNEAQGENPTMFIGNNDTKGYGGVTQLRFHPFKPHILYASFRGRASYGRVYAWDLRAVDSGVSNPPYQVFQVYRDINELEIKAKELNFNQKMKFDIDVTGRWLSLGDQAGTISTFDLNAEAVTTCDDGISFPSFQFEAHSDAVGSVSFNSCFPLLLSTSGSRHFDVNQNVESDESSDDEEDNEEAQKAVIRRDKLVPFTYDSSVKIWDMN